MPASPPWPRNNAQPEELHRPRQNLPEVWRARLCPQGHGHSGNAGGDGDSAPAVSHARQGGM